MASGKRQARRRRQEAYLSSLPDLTDAFEAARSELKATDARRDQVRQSRACTSKKRYATAGEARDAIASCAAYGRRGLSSYRCPYCHGYHLTSHPRSEREDER